MLGHLYSDGNRGRLFPRFSVVVGFDKKVRGHLLFPNSFLVATNCKKRCIIGKACYYL